MDQRSRKHGVSESVVWREEEANVGNMGKLNRVGTGLLCYLLKSISKRRSLLLMLMINLYVSQKSVQGLQGHIIIAGRFCVQGFDGLFIICVARP